jgi:hypothetical protein
MIKKITACFIFMLLLSGKIYADSAEKQTCCYYDISDNPSATLSPERINIISEQLRNSDASIIVLAGLRGQAMLDSIVNKLDGFIFSELIETSANATQIAMIAKFKPEKFEALTDLTYNIKKGTPLPVQRGFLHAIFNFNGYILHVFGANLKDRIRDPLYNQYDMRRYEARILRKLITAVIKKEKKEPANIILLAGLNDTCGKAPVKDIYNRRFGIAKRLFDLRPVDSLNVSWTALDESRDEYERVDYIIISSGIIPEIVINETMIIENPKWRKASLHRPVMTTFIPVNKPIWSDEKINAEFPHTIRSAHFNIGQKRKRGSAVTNPQE